MITVPSVRNAIETFQHVSRALGRLLPFGHARKGPLVAIAAFAVLLSSVVGSAWSAPGDPTPADSDLVRQARALILEQTSASLSLAEQYLRQAIAQGEVAVGFELLGDLYRLPPINDPLRALGAYDSAIEAGSRNARAKLGRMLSVGDGVPLDPIRAERLLREAVDLGDSRYAAEWLGDLYTSSGPLHNAELGAEAYQMAATAGSDNAALKLATMLFSGRDIAADRDKVEELLLLVVSRSMDARAAELLGDLYRSTWHGADLSLSIQYYETAVAGGRSSAMRKLAALFIDPNAGQFNPSRAEALLRQASERDPQAYEALGDLYMLEGQTHDVARAVQAYTQAAAGGGADATLKLVRLLLIEGGESADRINALAIDGAINAGGEQNLAAGIALLNAGPGYWATGVVHVLEAAKKLDVSVVAEDLLNRLTEQARAALVQTLLSQLDYALEVDGVAGPATLRVAENFCSQRADCLPQVDSIQLLRALLAAVQSG